MTIQFRTHWLIAGMLLVAACSADEPVPFATQPPPAPPPPPPTIPAPPPFSDSVVVQTRAIHMAVGDTNRLAALGRDTIGVFRSGTDLTWLSSAPEIATVSPDGVVTTKAVGHATIRITLGDASDTVGVTVLRTDGLRFRAPATVLVGGATTLVAEAIVFDSDEWLRVPVRWEADQPSVARISANGVLGAVGAGASVIRAITPRYTVAKTITVESNAGTLGVARTDDNEIQRIEWRPLSGLVEWSNIWTEPGSFDLAPDGSTVIALCQNPFRACTFSRDHDVRTEAVAGQNPSWSAEGRMIVSEINGTFQISRPDGSEITMLVPPPYGNQPQLSPDGKSILFVCADSLGRPIELCLMPIAQPNLVTTLGMPTQDRGRWASSGHRIVTGMPGRVLIRNLDTGVDQTIPVGREKVRHTVFSPDGRWIAFTDFTQVWVVSTDGQSEFEMIGTFKKGERITGLAWR